MSQNQASDDDVHIPDGDIMDDEPPQRAKSGLPPIVKVGGIAVMAIAVIGFGLFSASPSTETESKTRRPPNMDATPGGQNQADSDLYRESVKNLNEKRAGKAAELGVTSVPTPESILEKRTPEVDITDVDIMTDPEPEVEVAEDRESKTPVKRERRILPQPKQAPRTTESAQEQRSQPQGQPSNTQVSDDDEENPYTNRIASVMGSVASGLAPKQMITQSFSSATEKDDDVEGGNKGTAGSAPGNSSGGLQNVPAEKEADFSPENTLMRPGDVVYAETLTSVSSDMASPVMAEVVSGEHKGARLVGDFTADKGSDRLMVSFNSMTFADGRIFAINAVAVDGKSAETAVASDVKRRYVARYAPLLAATFINGYAQSMSQPKQTIVGVGDSAQIVQEQSRSKDALLAGVANASGAIASDIQSYAPKGPKIILRDGWPLAILFVDPVRIDGPAPEPATKPKAEIPRPGAESGLPVGVRPPLIQNN